MKLPISDDDLQRIRDALFKGHKIEAIKIYRGATLTGLAEAKSAVEQYEVELRISAPQTFQKPVQPPGTAGLGCAIIVVAMAVIVLVVLMLLEGDKAARARYSLAFGVVMTLMITLQSCALIFTAQRRKLGYALLTMALILTAVNVFLIVRP